MSTTVVAEFEKILGYTFSNPKLLKEALTHKSFINEIRSEEFRHNERLEFLGDAVLELIVTEYLFKLYPDRPEGELTSFRAALVRKESLADEAQNIQLGKYLFMSRGEEATGGRNRSYILANAFEAIIGAIYLQFGYDAAKEFILRNLVKKLTNIVTNRLDIDAKSKLQEIAQEMAKTTPNYKLISESGPDHNKQFNMGIFLEEELLESGTGHSKQEAEQAAAQKALKNWDKLYSKLINSGKIQRG